MSNIFDRFGGSKPHHSDATAQVLFDYEEHYMRLVKSYREEIKFIHARSQKFLRKRFARDSKKIGG